MPQYDYQCRKCDHEFSVWLSITDHEKQDKNREIRCPKCNSTDVRHVIESVFVTTSKKS